MTETALVINFGIEYFVMLFVFVICFCLSIWVTVKFIKLAWKMIWEENNET